MIVKYVDVAAIDSHSEKLSVSKSFTALGWEEFSVGRSTSNELIPETTIDEFIFTWEWSNNPSFPILPNECSISDFSFHHR